MWKALENPSARPSYTCYIRIPDSDLAFNIEPCCTRPGHSLGVFLREYLRVLNMYLGFFASCVTRTYPPVFYLTFHPRISMLLRHDL
jgi:hypothetical protein